MVTILLWHASSYANWNLTIQYLKEESSLRKRIIYNFKASGVKKDLFLYMLKPFYLKILNKNIVFNLQSHYEFSTVLKIDHQIPPLNRLGYRQSRLDNSLKYI